ncbi:PTS lactose/cellobiose transporter subunit IIA [Sporolactobacillus sp. Y61]|uniref:PTS system lactose-specific EIIA component n=1 Tax=Sporolactobacillus sp. Y61 TaxID=3160863 RepID=A0AAU8IIA6_9BACL
MNREDNAMVGFTIVAYAGDAKTFLLKALDRAKNGEYEDAEKLLKQADESIKEAHQEQTKVLANEAGGSDDQISFIMIHGQDTLMTTMMLRDMAKYFIDLYKKVNKA